MSSARIPEYNEDIFTDASVRFPYEQYRQIRELGPVVRYTPSDCYVIGRYDDVRLVLRSPETFISGNGVAVSNEGNTLNKGTVLTSDGARHDLLRKFEGEPITADNVQELKALVESEAEALIERVLSGPREIDAIRDIARYLPVKIVTELVGLPEGGRENMLIWAAAGFELAGPLNDRAKAALGTVQEWVQYTLDLTQAKVKPGSWSWRAFNLAEEGTITPEMVSHMLMGFIGPSLDTTILGTGNLLMLLGQNPDQWQALKADPSLIPNATNEALRLESPVRCFTRYVAKDAEIGGVGVPTGSRVLLLYGSANRDERRWEDAERFNIRRPNAAAHLAFGSGTHLCLGAHLARLEIHAVMKAMVDRVDTIEIGEPVAVLNNTLRGLASLPIRLN